MTNSIRHYAIWTAAFFGAYIKNKVTIYKVTYGVKNY